MSVNSKNIWKKLKTFMNIWLIFGTFFDRLLNCFFCGDFLGGKFLVGDTLIGNFFCCHFLCGNLFGDDLLFSYFYRKMLTNSKKKTSNMGFQIGARD